MLGKLKLWQKIALIIASFALPVGILAFFTFESIDESIDFARLEQSGMAFNRPLADLLREVTAHQLLLQRHHSGEKSLESEIAASQAQIDTAFSALDQVNRRFGPELGFAAVDLEKAGLGHILPEKVRTDWQALKAGWQQLAPARSEEQHERLIASIIAMIGRVNDTSDLALDPALDSAHLLTVTFEVAPFAQFHINQVGEHGLQAIAEPGLAQQIAIAGKASVLRDTDVPRLTNSIETSLREDAKFFGVSDSLQREVPPRLAEFKKAHDSMLAIADQIANGSKEVDRAAFVTAVNQAAATLSQLSQVTTNELDHLIEMRLAWFQHRRLWMVALSAGALLLASLLAWVVVRNLTVRLRRLSDAAQATAIQGDLSHTIEADGTDEIGTLARAFSQMVAHLCTLTSQVQKAAIVVNASVTEIAATSKQQQTTTSEVAATTIEIGATSKEISATSRELVKTVNQVSEVADQTALLANSGQASLGRMEETMGVFVEAVGAINSKLAVLNEKAGNINQVVTTITKVADQTNLLSLNAAIEAEKAGEYGRGFAVVATEIRRLADQTAVATFDIEQMVKEMQSAVAAGVMGMDKFGEQVRRGVNDVHQVSGQLAQIINQVQTLSPRFATVNEGMQAQATGADQITQALSQLSEATQQTAESLRQSNSSIEQLHDASRGMLTSLDGFKLRPA
jgi:methyl-accepting chemotaxis protein WspA